MRLQWTPFRRPSAPRYPWRDHEQILHFPERKGFGLVKRSCTWRARSWVSRGTSRWSQIVFPGTLTPTLCVPAISGLLRLASRAPQWMVWMPARLITVGPRPEHAPAFARR
jgi:hypothetical protein